MGDRGDRQRRESAFAELCELAERNGLHVEILTNTRGEAAIWIMPPKRREVDLHGTRIGMTVGVVASPFSHRSLGGWAPQLIEMLERRGYR